ncbi:phasin family protein [Cupriavidus basilensis]|uniref:Phasin family protein n=1 Tax=Cupriavidus basilensis TaxID=68895 RepID=A0ABT6AJT4_9BURK|nr:phasin family protein [Cupriavidus basilensis]MDF3832572.1 phasin family protein [Cupriavidus basilensis]
MASPSHAGYAEACQAQLSMALGLASTWAQVAEKIGALNLQAAKTFIAESADYFREASLEPISLALYRPELADVLAQRIASYSNSLNDILFGASGELSSEVQRQLAGMTGQDPFQWCLMGRDFLPDYGTTLPAMSVAVSGWVSAYLPAVKPLPAEPADVVQAPLLPAPADSTQKTATE